MASKIKHDGCKFCKKATQPVLQSILLKGEVMGFAICEDCIKVLRKEGRLIEKD